MADKIVETRVAIERSEVADLLARLVEKSIVSLDGETRRYFLLETVRQYASDALEQSGEPTQTRRRHLHEYGRLAAAAGAGLQGPEQEAWLKRLDAEHDNVRAALSTCSAEPEGGLPEEGLRLGAALWRYWDTRGYYAEGRNRLASLLDRFPGRTSARAAALDARGRLAYYHGVFEEARSSFQESYDLFSELGDRAAATHALHGLAMAEGNCGMPDQVREKLETCLATFRELGDLQGIARALNGLGFEALAAGDAARAEPLLTEALDIRRRLKDSQGEVIALCYLGICAARRGDLSLARRRFEATIDLDRRLGYRRGLAISLAHLAGVALAEGRTEEATELIRESTRDALALDDRASVVATLPVWAEVAAIRGAHATRATLLATYEANRSAAGLFPQVMGTADEERERLFTAWPEASEHGRGLQPQEAARLALASLA